MSLLMIYFRPLEKSEYARICSKNVRKNQKTIRNVFIVISTSYTGRL